MHENNNTTTVPTANMEQAAGNASVAAQEMPRFDSPVHVRVISYRKRETDTDGISAKAVLDGIVRAGILADDTAKQVKSITFENIKTEKGQAEKTIIEIDDENATALRG